MNFTLTEYQSDVVRSALTRYRNGRSLWSDDRGLTAVGLTAPTGAGKTVIASAVLEKLFYGTDSTSPNPNLTVLWLTDDPSLNEQSKAKIKQASGRFTDGQLVTLDAGYDEPELPVGKICFLNIQRLGTGASSHTSTSENRQHSFWSILANTVRNRPNDFLLVVDEAHRGASVKAGEKKTIMRTVMDGGQVSYKDAAGGTQSVTLPPAPIVLGISATPEKFEAAVDSSNRTLMKVAADTNKVRESGMVKDLINLAYSADDQTTDDTLLRLGTRDLIASEKLWAQEAVDSKRTETIKPIMVVQVPDRTTDKTLADIVDSIMEEWPRHKNSDGTDGDHLPIAFAHSFGEHTDIELKDERETRIRYIAPQDIQGHRDVRVVFFKTALTTGWDCPRAEIMVSMRAAKEYTSIAQLMGRMVRTPLASRVHSPGLEELNSVNLYLPHYDAPQVAKVVESFAGDADISIEVAINPVEFQRAEGVHPDVWNKTLIKQLKPVRKHNSESARLAALATILDQAKVANPAGDLTFEQSIREHLVGTMMGVYKTSKTDIDDKAEGYMSVDFETVSVDSLTGDTGASTTKTLTVSTKNLRQLKDAAVRKLPDGTGAWLYVHLLDYLNGDEAEASALTAAISFYEPTLSALETSAAALINTLRQQLSPALDGLPAEDRKLIKDALQSPTDPTPDGFKLPAVEKARTQKLDKGTKEIVDLPRFNGHLFTDDEGFPMVATSWETAVIDRIRHRIDGFQGWYRNPSSAKGLSVAYQDSGAWKLLYPDFLAYYHSAAGLRVDIIDPHNHSLSDTSAKWSALARYARACEKVGDGLYGQVLAVIKRGDTMWSLELGGPSSVEVEKALAAASSASEIEAVFEKHGGVL